MSEEQESLYAAVLITALVFLLVAGGLILLVVVYNGKRKRHLEEKTAMQAEFERELLKTQMEIREQTMQTIGADLHDNIGQLLSLTSLTLNSIADSDPEKSRKKVDTAIELTGRSIRELRMLGRLLQGEQLSRLGLMQAVEYELGWFRKAGQLEIDFDCQGLQLPAPIPEKDLMVFRMLQEALNNSVKHARATAMRVELAFAGGSLQVEVQDNGIGFIVADALREQTGMGLQTMDKRAKMIGGQIDIESIPGVGTSVRIIIPY